MANMESIIACLTRLKWFHCVCFLGLRFSRQENMDRNSPFFGSEGSNSEDCRSEGSSRVQVKNEGFKGNNGFGRFRKMGRVPSGKSWFPKANLLKVEEETVGLDG